ncbi:cysteine protease ATG4B-like isoform X1 [Typha angustifolia]|uniref:cysteine protease ATG4B-like isoform X1 n=2 Tax=Typha angustifolia TaxID=59011 RepID=UPI003C30179A
MMSLPERAEDSKFSAGQSSHSGERETEASYSEQTDSRSKHLKASLLSSVLTSTLSIFGTHSDSFSSEKKVAKSRNYGWTTAVKRVVSGGSMRRLQERLLGTCRADALSLTGEIWLLGKCYRFSPEESSSGGDPSNSYAEFLEDFSSRIWITYRKGFNAIGDSKFTSDVNWGCMIRSSQMIVAQALLFHHLGRSWRKPLEKPYDPKYIEILHLFGDSEACAFSIHNLIHTGKGYGLAVGSWLGPYAMCRTWETLIRTNRDQVDQDKGEEVLPMVLYVVSGDEDGERGGAPVVCLDVASRLCSNFSKVQSGWAPILLLVPLVLGLDKVNPRYIPFLKETFTFPQSLGILGGKPGASTYIVGIHDDKALYLDPHEVQLAVDIKQDNLEADTSSYHCSIVRHLPLDQIDPSLAIGFYCHDKGDFEDFCTRASELGEKANGAPLFTVAQSLLPAKPIYHQDPLADNIGDSSNSGIGESFGVENYNDIGSHTGEDEWQIL